MMVEKREAGGHTVRVGEELDGPGKRVYIDDEDWTEEYLYRHGVITGLRGMRWPRGEAYVATQVANEVRCEEFGPGVETEPVDGLTDSSGLLHRILSILR